jgi:hypothetical protein
VLGAAVLQLQQLLLEVAVLQLLLVLLLVLVWLVCLLYPVAGGAAVAGVES